MWTVSATHSQRRQPGEPRHVTGPAATHRLGDRHPPRRPLPPLPDAEPGPAHEPPLPHRHPRRPWGRPPVARRRALTQRQGTPVKPRDTGTRAETAVVRYRRDHGWPHAERRALRGNQDAGDITGTPGVCWSVKAG